MKKQDNEKFFKGEIFFYMIIILLVICIPISSVFTNALLSESNIEAEEVASKIKAQKKINESLEMQIYELGSLANIQEVAKENDLEYSGDRIIIVQTEE